MNRPNPQFRALLKFTFEEHGSDRRNWFMFGEDGHRRVPMEMAGVEGLHTVGMWINEPATLHEGDELEVDCAVLWPEGFKDAAWPGTQFRLWDSGFFADGIIIERFESGWPI